MTGLDVPMRRGGYEWANDDTFKYRCRSGLRVVRPRPEGVCRPGIVLGLDPGIVARCLLLHAGASAAEMDRLAPLPAEVAPAPPGTPADPAAFRAAAAEVRARGERVTVAALARALGRPYGQVHSALECSLSGYRAELLDLTPARRRRAALVRRLREAEAAWARSEVAREDRERRAARLAAWARDRARMMEDRH